MHSSSNQRAYVVWADFEKEAVLFVGYPQNLGPGESSDSNSISVDDHPAEADTNVDFDIFHVTRRVEVETVEVQTLGRLQVLDVGLAWLHASKSKANLFVKSATNDQAIKI